VNAPGFPYLYQAILRTLDATGTDPVVRFRSSEKFLTANNLAQASLLGITAAAIDPDSIEPVLVHLPSAGLRPVSAIGQPEATAILAGTTGSKLAALKDSLLGSLPPTAQLSSLIVKPQSVYTAHVDVGLVGNRVRLDRNGNLQADPDEPSTQVSSDGQIRLGLSTDTAPGDLLVAVPAPTGASGTDLDAVLLASPTDPQFSGVGTLELLLVRQGFTPAVVTASLLGFQPAVGTPVRIGGPLAETQAILALKLAGTLADSLQLPLAQAYGVLAASLAVHPAAEAAQLDWEALTAEMVNRLPRGSASVNHNDRLSGLPALMGALVQELRGTWAELQALPPRAFPEAQVAEAASALSRGVLAQLVPHITAYLQGQGDAAGVLGDLTSGLAQGLPQLAPASSPELSVVPWGPTAMVGGTAQFQVRLSTAAPAGGMQLGYRTSGVVSRQGSVTIEAGRRSALITLPLHDLTLPAPADLVMVLQELPAGFRLSEDLGAARTRVLPSASGVVMARTAVSASGPVVQGTERDDLLLDDGPGTVVVSGAGADRILLRPHPEEPLVVLDFDTRAGDRLQILRSDVPELADLLVINGRLQWGDQVLALLSGPAGVIPFLRDVSGLVELVDAPSPAPAAAPRPEPYTQRQQVLPGSAGTLQLNGAASRVTLTNTALEPIQPGDGLFWTGSGLSLSPATAGPRLVQLQVDQALLPSTQQLQLLLYRTDAHGHALAADGVTVVGSPEQAVIAQIGSVPDDGGRPLFTESVSTLVLSPGQHLRALLQQGNHTLQMSPALRVESNGNGLTLRVGADELVIHAALSQPSNVQQQLELARRAGLGDLLYLQDQELVDVQLFSSCANTNTLAFLKVDIAIDSASGEGQITVAGQPLSPSVVFRQLLLSHLDPGFQVSQGGALNQVSSHVWSVSSGTGFYTPVMLSQTGDAYGLGTAMNRDGRLHLRGIGDGAYAFEDLAADQGSDFDYNDGVIVVRPRQVAAVPPSLVAASGAGAVELAGANVLISDSAGQLVRSSAVSANVLVLSGGHGVVLREGWQADGISLSGGDNLLAMGRQGAGGLISLGSGTDQLVIGLGTRDASAPSRPDRLSGFDLSQDRLLLVGEGALGYQATADGLLLSLDGLPLLLLEGVTESNALAAAIVRDQPGSGDLIGRIQARGVLSVALPAALPGLSEQDPNGTWRGTAVDLVRAIAEELLGSADRVLFAQAAGDGEVRQSLRTGHIDLALLVGNLTSADLEGDGDRSWTFPGATPYGDLTFLLPENQTLFRHSVDRIMQTPLQAELLGLASSSLPVKSASTLSSAQQTFLDLQFVGEASTAGQGTPLQQGFAARVLNRLGNAAELWTRFFSGMTRPLLKLVNPLDIPVEGPALAAPAASAKGDEVAAILARGVLRVAVAGGSGALASLQPWQRQLLEAVCAGLGGAESVPALLLQPYATAADGLGLLSSGQVDLLLPDPADSLWLDGVVGVDRVILERPWLLQLLVNRASRITDFDRMGGSRLGLPPGARLAAALQQQIANSGSAASLNVFSSSVLASEALRLGQLDGMVVNGEDVKELQDRLANLGIDTEVLAKPLLAARNQVVLQPNQSRLRDALQAAASQLQGDRRE
jgi:hypothetical protein